MIHIRCTCDTHTLCLRFLILKVRHPAVTGVYCIIRDSRSGCSNDFKNVARTFDLRYASVLHAHCDCVVLALCLRYVCVALALHMYCTSIVKFFFIRTV